MLNKVVKIDIVGLHGSGKFYLAEKIKALVESTTLPVVIVDKTENKAYGDLETAQIQINVIHGDPNGE